jgi:hypothetical protein
MQGFQLGTQLRDLYTSATQLPEVPLDKIEVQSTDYDRTVDTANSLLLGLLSPKKSAQDPRKALGRPPGNCACRPNHGARSTPDCVASCLGIEASKRKIPEVRVVSGTDPALHQTRACKGWQDHAKKVMASEGWKHGPADDKDFEKEWATVRKIAKGGIKVQDKVWPGGGCKQCVNMSSVGRLAMAYEVRLRSEPAHVWWEM